jgi:hypothetical protein
MRVLEAHPLRLRLAILAGELALAALVILVARI